MSEITIQDLNTSNLVDLDIDCQNKVVGGVNPVVVAVAIAATVALRGDTARETESWGGENRNR